LFQIQIRKKNKIFNDKRYKSIILNPTTYLFFKRNEESSEKRRINKMKSFKKKKTKYNFFHKVYVSIKLTEKSLCVNPKEMEYQKKKL